MSESEGCDPKKWAADGSLLETRRRARKAKEVWLGKMLGECDQT
jgi:hypothetical protein